jgi:hypothetical protein
MAVTSTTRPTFERPPEASIREGSSISWKRHCEWCEQHPTVVVEYTQWYDYQGRDYQTVLIHHDELRLCPTCRKFTRFRWQSTADSSPRLKTD